MAKGARARARAEKASLPPLAAVAEELAALEARRLELLARRDELVAAGRASGRSWAQLADEAGTTRQALMQRVVRPPTSSGKDDVPLW